MMLIILSISEIKKVRGQELEIRETPVRHNLEKVKSVNYKERSGFSQLSINFRILHS